MSSWLPKSLWGIGRDGVVMDTEPVISVFTEDQVSRLTGLSIRQLRQWDRTKLFVPGYADEHEKAAYRRLYSLSDVAALRTISLLRNQHHVPLQQLGEVADELRRLSHQGWRKTTLYVLGKKAVVLHDPEDKQPGEATGGEPVGSTIPLVRIFSDIQRAVEALNRRPTETIGRITRHRDIGHNAPVVAGTRIPTAAIWRFKLAGYTVDEIIREYPDLTRQDVEAALDYEEAHGAA
jgi:uncharacterized protein (DUF433 family)